MDQLLYWETLQNISDIEQLLKENKNHVQKETETIKGIAIANLIRLGIPFEICKEYEEKEDSSNILDQFRKKEDTEPILLSETIKIYKDENSYYCNTDIMKRILREEYPTLILKIVPKEQEIIIPQIPEIDDDIDFVKKEEQEKIAQREKEEAIKREEEKKKAALNKPKEEALFDASRIPNFYVDKRFDDDKKGEKNINSFLYNHYKYKIGNEISNIYIYPIGKSEDAMITDIVVISVTNGATRGAVSKGVTSSVTYEIENTEFMVRGSWKDGEFFSQINVIKSEKEVTEISSEKIRPTQKTSTGYVKEQLKDVCLYLFPAKFGDNEDNGFALCAMVLSDGENMKLLMPTAEGTFCIGNALKLESYWMGENFYYETSFI